MPFLDQSPLLLCLLIFCARVVDVSLGTIRTIMVFRSYRLLAAVIGFFEVSVWLLAASHVLQHIDQWYLAASYAGGFATGNAVGIWLESKLAVGLQLIRAVSADPQVQLAHQLRQGGHSVTAMPGRGDAGEPVEVLLIVEKRRRLSVLLQRIEDSDPNAVCTVSDIKTVRTGRVVPANSAVLATPPLLPIKRK